MTAPDGASWHQHFMNSPHKSILAYLFDHFPVADAILVFILDHPLAWFTPKWRRKGRMALKAVRRYINYNRDVLPPERLAEFQENRDLLKTALLCGDRAQTESVTAKLESTLEAIPGALPSGLAENVEVLFVILAIFLGLRCYVVQPFRIPTGSMQPSLNGIRAIPQEGIPSLMKKIEDMVLYGGSYVHETAQKEKKIVRFVPGTKYLLLTVTNVQFDDGSTLEIPAAEAETRRYFLNQEPRFEAERNTPFRTYLPGDTIVNARFDAGDLILVNKMSYHFRKPERGEVFVFDTRGIEGIANKGSSTGQEGGTHYVKRLCGVPGDSLSIKDSQLIVNGEPAKEWTIQRVTSGKPPYQPCGYVALPAPLSLLDGRAYITEGTTVHLSKDKKRPYLREYVALGDNSTRENSFDSRYWGPVHQYNIVGPASFCLWPFTSHWGLIP